MERGQGLEEERGGVGGALGPTVTFFLNFLQVNNLSQRSLAISVHFRVPVRLNGVAVWDVAMVAPSQVPPASLPRPGSDPTVPHTLLPGNR